MVLEKKVEMRKYVLLGVDIVERKEEGVQMLLTFEDVGSRMRGLGEVKIGAK